MKIKEFCFKNKCSFRKIVGKNKAYCMLPKCLFNETRAFLKGKKVNKEYSAKEIIQNCKRIGLIP